MARPVTLLSDYGHEDEFAGVCRAVIASIAPEAGLIDLTHGIPRHDVRAGALALARALPFAPPGVHLAVVDPGVGSERRAVAVRVAAEERVLVGPDNGLLWPAIERFGGAVEAVEVSRSPVRIEPVSASFHGRDLFAPVAAHLALGMALAALGEPLELEGLARLELPEPDPGAGGLRAVVGYLDSFGNATLLASPEAAAAAGLEPGDRVRIEAGEGGTEAVYALTFADVAVGELLLFADSSGSLALAVNRGSAAERLGLAAGEPVLLRPA